MRTEDIEPDFPGSVFIRHPVAALDRDAVYQRVDEAMEALVLALLGGSD